MVYSHVASMIAVDLRDAHGGRNQWVWSPVRSTIKRKILVDQEIKGCLKAGSSDQEQNLAIKNFDRRRRWKYRIYSGDYPLTDKGKAKEVVTIKFSHFVTNRLRCYCSLHNIQVLRCGTVLALIIRTYILIARTLTMQSSPD